MDSSYQMADLYQMLVSGGWLISDAGIMWMVCIRDVGIRSRACIGLYPMLVSDGLFMSVEGTRWATCHEQFDLFSNTYHLLHTQGGVSSCVETPGLELCVKSTSQVAATCCSLKVTQIQYCVCIPHHRY